MLESLLTDYGYPVLIIGTFLEGETILILGGIAAHLGYLSLHGVITCGLIGTLLGDQLYFIIGRRHGQAFLARRPTWKIQADRVLKKWSGTRTCSYWDSALSMAFALSLPLPWVSVTYLIYALAYSIYWGPASGH
jgi:hypothetical protein